MAEREMSNWGNSGAKLMLLGSLLLIFGVLAGILGVLAVFAAPHPAGTPPNFMLLIIGIGLLAAGAIFGLLGGFFNGIDLALYPEDWRPSA